MREVTRSQHVLGITVQRAARFLKVGSYQGRYDPTSHFYDLITFAFSSLEM